MDNKVNNTTCDVILAIILPTCNPTGAVRSLLYLRKL